MDRDSGTISAGAWSRVRHVLLAGMLLLLFLAHNTPARADQLSDLIERTRAARGPGLGTIHGLHLSGTINAAGVNGTFDRWVDLTSGAYAESYDASPLSGGSGFDGQSFWIRDAKGVVLPQYGPWSRISTSNEQFESLDDLYRPNYGGAEVSYLGSRQDEGIAYQVISFQPSGARTPQELWFDDSTHLLARKVTTLRGMTSTTEYSKYQSVGGLMIPYKSVTSRDTGSRKETDVTSAAANPADLVEHLRRPTSNPNDFSLSGGQTSIPIEIIGDSIYVDVMLNGKGPFHFNFDTGGRNVVDPTVAYQAGAKPTGSLRIDGVGPYATEGQVTQIDQVAIGGATLSAQSFLITELGPRTNWGGWYGTTPKRELQGLIGYELPARFMVTIDYATSRMTIQNAEQSPAGSHGDDMPIAFSGTWPILKCTLSGFDGACLLDTGSSVMMVNKPFIDAHPAVLPRWFSGSNRFEGGFGGLSKGKGGTLTSAQFGSHTLNNVAKTIFSMDERGLGADPYVAAIVGNSVWEHFILTLNYPGGWLRLKSPGTAR
jgi:hypothetical protein